MTHDQRSEVLAATTVLLITGLIGLLITWRITRRSRSERIVIQTLRSRAAKKEAALL